MAGKSPTHQRIYAVVFRIPRGRVATYGQIARLAGLPGQARLVGYALSALPEGSRVPWHRVVNARGQISLRRDGSPFASIQRHLLEKENVRFDTSGSIALSRFRWRPRTASIGKARLGKQISPPIDDLRPEYRFDYSKSRPNRFARKLWLRPAPRARSRKKPG